MNPSQPLLSVRGIVKRYGGLAASDGVDLDVATGEIHSVIGPNGAGKTTLVGQLSGEIRPDAGQILFDGRDITTVPTYRRSALGLARSFQVTSIFPRLTVLENVALAVQAHAGHSFVFWRPAAEEERLREPAREALARTGLERHASSIAATLAHGEQRRLEVAMAIATEPRLVLLDEPTAGMGPEETMQMVDLLHDLRRDTTILLVEHDMDVVFALSDRISVLVYGRVIATGSPEAIRANADVRDAYLGEEYADG